MAVDLLVLRTTRGDETLVKVSFRMFTSVVSFAHVPRFHADTSIAV